MGRIITESEFNWCRYEEVQGIFGGVCGADERADADVPYHQYGPAGQI